MSSTSPTQTIACPYCSEEIKATAIKCKHCSSMLVDADELPAQVAQRRGTGDLAPSTLGRPAAALTGQPVRQGTDDLSATPLGPQRGSGEMNQPGRPRGTTGKFKQPAFPPSPLPNWATKKNLLIGGGVVAVLGLLVNPKFTLCCLFLGVPSVWVLLDSTWRYKKPSWLAAGLGPTILPLLYYGFKRLLVKPEIHRLVGKRPDGHPHVAFPPALNTIATLMMVGILMLWWSADSQDRPKATRHLGATPPPVVDANEKPGSDRLGSTSSQGDTSTRSDAADNREVPRSYLQLSDVVEQYNEMTDVQKAKWEADNEDGSWVTGIASVDAVRERNSSDPFKGEYYVVVSNVSHGARAILFFDKSPRNEKLVLGLSKGSRVSYKGKLTEIRSGFWSTGYVRVE